MSQTQEQQNDPRYVGLPPGASLRPVNQNQLPKVVKTAIENRVYDLGISSEGTQNPVALEQFLADLSEQGGMHKMAAQLRHEQYDDTFSGSMGRLWDRQVRVSTVATVMFVGAVAYLLYSGVAYVLELPGGIFGKRDLSMGETGRTTRRSAA